MEHTKNSPNLTNFRNTRAARGLTRTLQYAVLIILAIVLVFPYFYMFIRSFMTSDQVKLYPVEFWPAPFSVQGWSMFFEGDYIKAFLRTVLIVGINVIVVPCSASLVQRSNFSAAGSCSRSCLRP